MKQYITTTKNMNSSEAYMLDKHGNAIWVDIHPYGSPLFPEANASAALFLLKNGGRNKRRYIEFLHQYMASVLMRYVTAEELADIEESEFEETLQYALLKYGRSRTAYLLAEFAGYNENNDTAVSWLMRIYDANFYADGEEVLDYYDANDNGNDICTELNQEYARIRIGGMYESVGDATYYCRIGSRGFDWGRIVKQHIRRFSHEVQYVTIERDRESDHGPKAVFDKSISYLAYTTEDGTPILNMPIYEFLNEHDTPVLSNLAISKSDRIFGSIGQQLKTGAAYLNILSRKNPDTAQTVYHRMLQYELDGLVPFDVQ